MTFIQGLYSGFIQIFQTYIKGMVQEVAVETCDMIWNDLAGRLFEEILDDRVLCSLDQNELESLRATVIQAYNFAFEVCSMALITIAVCGEEDLLFLLFLFSLMLVFSIIANYIEFYRKKFGKHLRKKLLCGQNSGLILL